LNVLCSGFIECDVKKKNFLKKKFSKKIFYVKKKKFIKKKNLSPHKKFLKKILRGNIEKEKKKIKKQKKASKMKII